MSKREKAQCKSLLVFLSDFVDGDLSEQLCQEIETHTAECEDCRIVVDTLRKTVSLYRKCADECAEIPGEVRSQLFKTLNLEDYMEK